MVTYLLTIREVGVTEINKYSNVFMQVMESQFMNE
jgi:hypothetical protein